METRNEMCFQFAATSLNFLHSSHSSSFSLWKRVRDLTRGIQSFFSSTTISSHSSSFTGTFMCVGLVGRLLTSSIAVNIQLTYNHGPIIINNELVSLLQFPSKCSKMDYPTPESDISTSADPPSWTQLIPDSERKHVSILKQDDCCKIKDLKEEEEKLTVANDDKSNPPRIRRESLMGTFHRHLRQSLKAVSEPGPFAR